MSKELKVGDRVEFVLPKGYLPGDYTAKAGWRGTILSIQPGITTPFYLIRWDGQFEGSYSTCEFRKIEEETINLEPTPEGYRNIALRFAGQILGDVKVARQKDDRQIMHTFVQTVGYLAAKHPELYQELLDTLKPKS